jgi:hypothetical protein
MSERKERSKRQHIAWPILKKLQDLQSWRSLYRELGTSNPVAYKAIEVDIKEFKATHDITDNRS